MKKRFTQTLLAAVLVFLFAANSQAQCDFTVTDLQSYLEDFESMGAACWDVETTSSANWSTIAGSSSTAAAFSYNSPGEEARLVSPVIDISSVSEATLSFSYAMVGGSQPDELEVSYRSSETDVWHVLGTFNENDWTNFFEASFTLSALTATYQISFLGRGMADGLYILIDNVEIASNTSCPRPVNVAVSDLTPLSATLSWDTSEAQESWTVDLNGETQTVTTVPCQVALIPGTSYTLKVKAQCGGGEESEWSVPIQFTTPCEEILVTNDITYHDDFETADVLVCWENETLEGQFGWEIGFDDDSHSRSALFAWLGATARLISTPMDLSGVSYPILTFEHKQTRNVGVDNLQVWYRTSEQSDWMFVEDYSYETDWEEVTLTLPEPSSTYQIAFWAHSNYSNGTYVDNVSVGNDSSVGLGEQVLKAVASPNPTLGKVRVDTNLSEGKVTVYDLFGKQLLSVPVRERHAELDLDGFAKGVYMARVSGASGSTTFKLVKE